MKIGQIILITPIINTAPINDLKHRKSVDAFRVVLGEFIGLFGTENRELGVVQFEDPLAPSVWKPNVLALATSNGLGDHTISEGVVDLVWGHYRWKRSGCFKSQQAVSRRLG